ncbi:YqiA/YcfP family alpha/beta fold hydrolase [Alkanindiges sp. WGS2144]|uniref:YqiA/YcfP family alpha/beta fold hydrolase n=1 Tax=Alkanindiges sp. WGS2144 TaxID=3366808 RepID=UPI003752E0B7
MNFDKTWMCMQLIYIHGLNSDAMSVKGQMLEDWCKANRPEIKVQRPDLNMPPKQVMQWLQDAIESDPHTGLVGSSLGGFYATACVAKHAVKAVLVNPSVRPFERFKRFFANGEAEYCTETGWLVTPDQLDDLQALFFPVPPYPDRILVLLKQGDEVLDYREAENYFSQDHAQSALIIEPGGDHFMSDMDTKIPLMINFLFDR